MKKTIKLAKWSQRTLDRETMRKQLAYGLSRALAGSRGEVWKGTFGEIGSYLDGDGRTYSVNVYIKRTGRAIRQAVAEKALERIEQLLQRAVRGKGWVVNGEAKPDVRKDSGPETTQERKPETGYAAFSYDKVGVGRQDFFGHLYDRDPQIDLVLSAVEEYQRSEYANRFHCLLYGEPACGKTEILRSLSRMLGSDAVLHFDATSTTAAGAKQLLTESASIPPILCIEEIEKADEASLRWLLGVLDYRSEIRYLKHRSGLVTREVKLLCLATVNDFGLFNKMMDGALASRFSHKIYCPRPGRNVLEKILEREVSKSKGDPKWIQPALDYCLVQEKTNDPRRVITVCLCGKDKLLTGEYQKMLAASRPESK